MVDLARLAGPPHRALSTAGRRTREVLDARRWGDLLLSVPRAAAFYARSWQHLAVGHPDGPLPVRPTLGVLRGALVDELATSVFRTVTMPPPAPVLHRRLAEASLALELFERRGWLDDPVRYHRSPPPPSDVRSEPESVHGIAYEHVTFDSGYAPFPAEPGRDRWLAYEANRTAHAWVLRHGEPRPWLVCVHGAVMGSPTVDVAVFRAGWLHRRLGLNVAMVVQPLHGPRRSGSWHTIGYPTEDPLDSVHAAAQSVWDVRRTIAWIRSRHDEPVGLWGLSLGGFAVSLVAGVEDDLACVIAGIPVVELAELLGYHLPTRMTRRREYEKLAGLSLCLHRVVSPLALEPRLPLDRRFIFAGIADRLVHPYRQVHELWDHWGQPSIEWYQGGHMGFFRSPPVGQFVHRALVASGLVPAEELP